MIKRICFFTTGFAFNRLVRMKYYEKIFPPDTEIFLFTTNKHESFEESKKKWDLKRTKVFVDNYSPIKTPFNLRNFCRKNKIQRLTNLGEGKEIFFILISHFLKKSDFVINFTGEELTKFKFQPTLQRKILSFFQNYFYIFVSFFSTKISFVGAESYRKSKILFFNQKKKITFSHPAINLNLFKPKNKVESRKKLNLPLNKKIILRVGRLNQAKGGKSFIDIVNLNKDKLFLQIGQWNEKEIPKKNLSNLIHLKTKNQNQLVDYYNASNLTFSFHLAGDQIGIFAEESLACGIPTLQSLFLKIWDSPSILKSEISSNKINKVLNKFFSLSEKQKRDLSKNARDYAKKNFSYESWEKSYLIFYLK